METVTGWLSWIFGSVGDTEDNVEKEEMKEKCDASKQRHVKSRRSV